MGEYLVHVLLLGSVYALLAAGFCLYFGTLRLINLSHGDVFTLGAFAALAVSEFVGVPQGLLGTAVLLLVSSLVGLLLGFLIERIAFRQIRHREPYALLLTSVAVSVILREGLAYFYPNGANPHDLKPPLTGRLHVGASMVTPSQLLTVLLGATMLALLTFWVRRSAKGRWLRATSEDPVAASLIGINVDRIMIQSFMVASVLACVAGCLYGLSYEVVVYDMGLLLGLRGFTAATLGGLNRIEGAIVGGLLLAAVELGVAHWLPRGSGYRDVVVFVVLILVLAFRPHGLIGRTGPDITTSLARSSVHGVAR